MVELSLYSINRKLDINFNLNSDIKKDQILFTLINVTYNEVLKQKKFFLHNLEIDQFNKFKFIKKKYNFLLGRYAAKEAVIAYYNLNVKDKINYFIVNGVFGKPIINDAAITLSISHTVQYGLAVVSNALIKFGVDLEVIDKKNSLFINIYNNELNIYKKQITILNIEQYKYLIWSCKEALVKAISLGFTISMDILEISNILLLYRDQEIFYFKTSFKNFDYFYSYSVLYNSLIISISLPKLLVFNSEKLMNILSELLKICKESN